MNSKTEYKVCSLKDIGVGDLVYSPSGQWVPVVESYEEHVPQEMFEVEIDGKHSFLASGNHLWYVISDLDRETFSSYYRKGRKLFSTIPNKVLEEANSIINNDKDKTITIDDLIDILGVRSHPDSKTVLSRLLDSIGPVMEDTIVLKDVLDESLTEERKMRAYSFTQVFDQIKHFIDGNKKQVLVGKVYTTRELFDKDLGKIMLPKVKVEL